MLSTQCRKHACFLHIKSAYEIEVNVTWSSFLKASVFILQGAKYTAAQVVTLVVVQGAEPTLSRTSYYVEA